MARNWTFKKEGGEKFVSEWGADNYIVKPGNGGIDWVREFNVWQDTIDLTDFGTDITWEELKENIKTYNDFRNASGLTIEIDLREWDGGILRLQSTQIFDSTTLETIKHVFLLGPGTRGDDELTGTSGQDYLRGYQGDDVLRGEGDRDNMHGGDGKDEMHGGAGNDRMYGGEGDDELNGDAGDDHLEGNAGTDILRGGAGNDFLDGGADADIVGGIEGNNTLIGGAGNDWLYDGSGDDRFVFAPGSGKDTIFNFAKEGGNDKIDVSGYSGISGFSDLEIRETTSLGSLGGRPVTIIKLGDDSMITLYDVKMDQIDADDFTFTGDTDAYYG